MRVNIRKII